GSRPSHGAAARRSGPRTPAAALFDREDGRRYRAALPRADRRTRGSSVGGANQAGSDSLSYGGQPVAIDRAWHMAAIVAGLTRPTRRIRRVRGTSCTLSRLATDTCRNPSCGPSVTSVESPRILEVTGAAITASSMLASG